ncbi:MAG: RNA 2',3'-cyclic phosphodiesterase [Anaerolineales bacterium]|nr:RNA 2',3'-cyclic phosphodiesterase [Anaerolineales bacterium]MDW8161548.1 RNA 2',3'-cyclic phosphodiesterase [Anaerolineales bacterium]
MSQVLRAFIAIELPSGVQQRLGRVIQRLQDQLRGVAIRWVKPQNLHLTLKFLGEVSLNNLELIKEILAREAAQVPSFEFSIGELGAFPNAKRPRVLWLHVTAPPPLLALQRSLDLQTARLGYLSEEREYSPHLTIGRVNRQISQTELNRITLLLQEAHLGLDEVVSVTFLTLFRSDLHPDGSVYTPLAVAPLKKPLQER